MHVTIISESILFRRTVERFLQDLGYKTAAYTTADEAVAEATTDRDEGTGEQAYTTEKTGAVLLDPGEAKNSVLRKLERINRKFREAKIMVIDGDLWEEGLMEAAGLYGFLRKPIRLRELELMVRQIAKNGRPERRQGLHIAGESGDSDAAADGPGGRESN